MPQGFAPGSKNPTMSLPASSRKYAVSSGQRRTGQVARQPLDRFGDQVEVLGGVERDGDAVPRAELARPHPGAVDDDVAGDIAGLGSDAGDATVACDDLEDRRVLEDLAPAEAKGLGDRLGGIDRVRDAVRGQVGRADDPRLVHERPEPLRLGAVDRLDVEAHRSWPSTCRAGSRSSARVSAPRGSSPWSGSPC